MAGETTTRERWWRKPTDKAQECVDSIKQGIHVRGKKKDQPLSEYEKGRCSGYLNCMSDNAGMYRYKKAMNKGATQQEAATYSKIIGKGGEAMLAEIEKRNKKK